jgi:protein subunit release factor A
MTEMAKMQLDEAKERLPELEEEIKFMLIPKDPEDAKNVMVGFVPVPVGMKQVFCRRFI